MFYSTGRNRLTVAAVPVGARTRTDRIKTKRGSTRHFRPAAPRPADSVRHPRLQMKFRGKIVDVACLNHFTREPTLSSVSRVVTHDVPVDIVPRRLWHEFKEPIMPDFDVSVYLPPLKTMKSVVDRMKNLSNFLVASHPSRPPGFQGLVIEANLNGQMNLKIETDLVSVTTHFKDLGNPPWGDDAASPSRESEAMAEARVDVRRLQQFLVGQQVNPSRAMCNIVHQGVVHLILLHEDVSLQYFIPAVA
ncbi:hypothetical protein F2P81_019705 [Scophthalmus maximus]|uniref:Checkpoint protein n=1 Tax=Scophthalmus maximus TaxID=52904 RepID=A0A6A4S8S1_SCOMX|nr:hypothetical protein F2P81_019705 [Scophthalmus maximus]